WLIIQTESLELKYKENSGGFTETNLTITPMKPGYAATWHPGMPDTGNLLGTTRTLDSVSGKCPLEPGILSRTGWTVVDDLSRPLFDPADPSSALNWPWCAPRRNKGAIDWYFFGHGRDYKQALKDFTAVAGRIPLPAYFAFGAWWSRYWAY